MSIVNVERIIKKAHKSMFLNKFICFSISIPKLGISADAILWYSIILKLGIYGSKQIWSVCMAG